MISKTKEAIKKLELGILEFFVGALMVIGLIGYFGSVPADLDWIDHTVSFILFSYLFYKLNITSILFGKTSKFANSAIVISYFSLFFKDIISYTKLDAFKFKVIIFVDYFYIAFRDNLFITNVVTFYIGVIGIIIISAYITKKIDISHPSLLYAVYPKKIKNNIIKFLSIFVLLLGFYYFVYNTILEWLEFVIDDPVVAVGVIFYVYRIVRNRNKFHKDNFVFKIGEFSSSLYAKFVSLFHYKKTLTLAISGLLMLHALSDLGVFAYSLTFLKENSYLQHLSNEHKPFLKLFLEDLNYVPNSALIPLFINYLLNDLSLIIFLLMPIVIWARLFLNKEFNFSRVLLFFIYSSSAAYLLLPGYIMKPLSEYSITGVDISPISLLAANSILDNFFQEKTSILIAVSLISIISGLIIYILSSNSKVKRELYAISMIGGLAFYAVYLYYFFSSLLVYFYKNILITIFTKYFLIGITLIIFLLLSIIFYLGGYVMFLYELRKKFASRKRAQVIGDTFKYILFGLAAIFILIMGYKFINNVNERACRAEITKFEIDLKNIDKSLSFGARELRYYDLPCKVDRIYFFDLEKDVNPNDFKDLPILEDSIKSRINKNVFLVKGTDVKGAFYAGKLEIRYPYYACFKPKFDKISFFVEGAGQSAVLESAPNQPECAWIPVNPEHFDASNLIDEAFKFGKDKPDVCRNCPADANAEKQKIEMTKNNVEIFRSFSSTDKKTKIEIIIKAKKGSKLNEFRLYEYIPKECIEDLQKYIEEVTNDGANVQINADPLIMWYFNEISGEKRVSYKLTKELDDQCRQLIKALGVAQSIEKINKI